MGASCSSCFYTAEAEECPFTVVDAVAELVAELEALTMVGSEGGSASRRSEYYSARCEAMMRSKGQCSDAVALEIEFSKPHWSEVNRRDVAPQSVEEEELNRENRQVLEQLVEEHPDLFWHDLDGLVLGRMIAEGGQAQIFEVEGRPHLLMKVFKRGTPLRALRGSCPLPVLNDAVRQCLLNAGLLEDGRFAFVMDRFWGDLRKLIDQAMQERIWGPPFPYTLEGATAWNFHPTDFMLEVAVQMRDLHEKGVSHRDLKASNILLLSSCDWYEYCPTTLWPYKRWATIADFECSIGVWGTRYWRAPEILEALGNASIITNEQWKQADHVYSYGMTCFEIVTGRIPFDGELKHTKAHHKLVIDGKRPQLPRNLDDAMKDLITRCWAPNPSLRPTFSQIVDMVEPISKRQCEFRLFDIGDELPPQYHLATIEEVLEYTIALSKAMPKQEIANLENGSVYGRRNGLQIRLVKDNNARYKLARLRLLDEEGRFSCYICM